MEFITFVGEKLNLLDLFPYNWYLSKPLSFVCRFFNGLLCELIFQVIEGDPIYSVDNMDRVEVY